MAAEISPSIAHAVRTLCAASTFLMSISTSAIMSAMAAISASFIAARGAGRACPSRMPLAWNGERVSNGMVFLFDGDAGFVQGDL
jgi:hypothetical protein